MDVVICSSDKDLMQLCGDGSVAVLDTMKNRRIGPAEVRRSSASARTRVGDVLALMGDSIDNVPGVAGIGPKTAAELINRFGTLDALLAAAAAGEVKGKRGAAIVEARDAVRVSRELVRAARRRAAAQDDGGAAPDRARTRRRCARCSRSSSSRAWLDQLSASGAAAIAPHAENTPPGPAVPEAVAPVAPPPPVARGHEPRRAGGAGRRHPRPRAPSGWPRSTTDRRRCAPIWSASGVALGRPPRLPAARRTATWARPACLPEAEALAVLAPLLASPDVAKHVHDGKTLEVLLLRRGWRWRRRVGLDAGGATCWTPRARATTWTSSAAAKACRAIASRASWMGTGA